MSKLTKKAIRDGRTYGRTDGRTDPNYRKASLLKILRKPFDDYKLKRFLKMNNQSHSHTKKKI